MVPESEGNDLYPVGEQQRCGHSRQGFQATGRAARFEKTAINVLRLGDRQHHGSSPDELSGQIVAITIHNLGRTRQDGVSVSIDQMGRRAWGGQAAKLFGADRYPVKGGKLVQAGQVPFALSIVSRTQSGETGADQTFFWLLRHGDRR